MWSAKFSAAAKHGLVTLLVAAATYMLVFHIWYPDIFSRLMPGAKLFLLVLGVEVALGPCMSLIIFNPTKSKRELIIDYTVIGIIQLSALIYGVLSVVDSRPAYIVFVRDRLEVVSAIEITKADLAEASLSEFAAISWLGPRFVCTRSALDAAERQRLLFDEIPTGKDVQHLPRFYRACGANELLNAGFNIAKLKSIAALKGAKVLSEGMIKLDDNKVWLPIMGKTGVWVAVIDASSPVPIGYIQFDPF